MDKQTFIRFILRGALEAYKKYNTLPSLTLAQAILESNWGESAPGNMLFGIKWTENCGYDKQLLWTTEYINNSPKRVQDYFRKYNNLNDSIRDHADFLKVNNRYEKVLQCTNYVDACKAIQTAGYATDPNYSAQLIELIEQYNLNKWDGVEYKMEEVTDPQEALDFLLKEEVITNKQYWIEVLDTTQFFGQFLLNVANKIKKG